MIGNLIFALFSHPDRSGNAVLSGLFAWGCEEAFNARVRNRQCVRGLKRTMSLIIQLVENLDDIIVNKESALRQNVHIYTDASSDGGANGQARLGAVMIDADGRWYAT